MAGILIAAATGFADGRAEETQLLTVEVKGNALKFEITDEDVINVVEKDERVWIKLSPAAAGRLSDFVSRNDGEMVRFLVGDLLILRIVVSDAVHSDVIVSTILDKSDRSRLIETLGKDGRDANP